MPYGPRDLHHSGQAIPPSVDEKISVRLSEIGDLRKKEKTDAAAIILNETDGDRALTLGCDQLDISRMSWTVGNVGASGLRGAMYLRTGPLRSAFAHVYAELLTECAGLDVEVLDVEIKPVKGEAGKTGKHMPIKAGNAEQPANGLSWLRIAQSGIPELGSGEGLFSKNAQEERAHKIRTNWRGIMSERRDIHAALTFLNAALPFQLPGDNNATKSWAFDYGYPADGNHANLRLSGLKTFGDAGVVRDALKALNIITEQQTVGPDTNQQPIVMVKGWKSIQRIIGSDLGEQTRTALAAMAGPAPRGGLVDKVYRRLRGQDWGLTPD